MKHFLTILFVFFLCSAQAATYYFSSVSGDDSRTSAQAQSSSTPWKSLSKLNAFFASLQPGDFVLFNRGETFHGSITVNKSGTSSAPITIGAYGEGSMPVIHGWTVPGGWTQTGTNVWTSAPINGTPVNGLNVVTINGKIYAKGRTPDAGYYTGTTYVRNKSARNVAFSGHNYTGGEIVLRRTHWIIDVNKIDRQSIDTLFYSTTVAGSAVTTSNYQQGWGAFIQNHPDCLNQNGEWYFNKSTKQISVYWPTNPGTSVQVATQANNLVVGARSNVSFKNITFEGAYGSSVSYSSTGYDVIFDSCLIQFAYEGVKISKATTRCKFLNSVVQYTLNSGLHNNSINGLIDNCVSRVSGAWPGMGGGGDGQYFNVRIGSDPSYGGTIRNSLIDSSGYVGLAFNGNNILIENNVIKNHCFVKDDGGGIYAYNSARIVHSNRVVRNNLFLNALGAPQGTNTKNKDAFHLYFDGMTDHVEAYGNTFAYAGQYSVFFNSANNCNVRDNSFYWGTFGAIRNSQYASDQIPYANTITSNIFVGGVNVRQVGVDYNNKTPTSSWGTQDSNRYATRDGYVGRIISTNYTLPNWRLKGFDKNGTTRNATGFLFLYNEDKTPKTFDLTKNYVDIYGTNYSGSVTLDYTKSLFLFEVPVAARPLITSNTENKLGVNTPNPARGSTTIRYHIASDNASISITDMTGILLKTIILNRGSKQVALDTWNLAPGIYNYTLYVEGQRINTKRMVVTR